MTLDEKASSQLTINKRISLILKEENLILAKLINVYRVLSFMRAEQYKRGKVYN